MNTLEVLHSLVRKAVRFNILNKDKKRKWESSISILSEIHYDGGMVYYRPSAPFIDTFLRPSSYAYLNIKHQVSLSSKHSLALWEYCCEQLDSTKSTQLITPYVLLEQLKELLGIEGMVYEEYKVFNNKVLKKAITEINKKTDINIDSVFVRKSGAKVNSIAFSITRVSNVLLPEDNIVADNQLELLDIDIIATISNSLERQDLDIEAKSIGLSVEGIEKFLKQYSALELLNGVRAVQKTIDQGVQIKNVPGYLWKLLDNGIIEVANDKEEVLAEQRKTRLYEAIMKYSNLSERDNKFFRTFADLYEDTFTHWISQTEFVKYQDGVLHLKAKSDFFRDWIITHYESQIKVVASRIYDGFIGVEIICRSKELI